jgi:hypothetical protein
MNKFLSLLIVLGLLGPATLYGQDSRPVTAPSVAAAAVSELPAFNQRVLRIAREYPTDGTHDYWWPRNGESSYDGSSEDIYLNGQLVMKGEPERRTFCCGFTMEVFLKAYQEYLDETGDKSAVPEDQWGKFKTYWFVREVNGPGPSDALEEFGLGRQITQEEVLPGDFVQIWRRWDPEKKKNGSGHSVIFLEWVKDDAGTITGLKYLSTQPGTKGIGEVTEYFGAEGETKGMHPEYTTYGRVELAAVKTVE